MGSRDRRHREPKKPKKDAKKPLIAKILPESIEVEEVRRGRRRARSEEAKE